MLYFGILHRVGISVLNNCLFVFLLTFLLFCIVCAIACLPYFLQSFCLLLNCFFFAQLLTFTFFGFLQVLAGTTSSFSVVFCRCGLIFSAFQTYINHCSMLTYSHCIIVVVFADFLARFVCLYFCLQNALVYMFCVCLFFFFSVLFRESVHINF